MPDGFGPDSVDDAREDVDSPSDGSDLNPGQGAALPDLSEGRQV